MFHFNKLEELQEKPKQMHIFAYSAFVTPDIDDTTFLFVIIAIPSTTKTTETLIF